MGFNWMTWTPGVTANPLGSLVSIAALLGSEVRDPDGHSAGRLSDVVVHWTTQGAYPSVKAIVVRR
jgi:sporulation protein YlmC with PRC-barrel domain